MGELVALEIKSRSAKDQAKEALEFLNRKTGRNFRPVSVHLEMIEARIKEGYTLEDIKAVIAMKVREWMHDEVMTKFLRPATLFARSNFSNYVGFVDATDVLP